MRSVVSKIALGGAATAALLSALWILRDASREHGVVSEHASVEPPTKSGGVVGSLRPDVRAGPSAATPESRDPSELARDPSTVEVRFESGAAFQVRLRDRPAIFKIDGNAKRLSDVYDDLRSRAVAGDTMASSTLHRLLEHCKQSYGDEQALGKAIQILRRDGVVTLPDESRPLRKAADRAMIPELERAFLRGPYEFCKGTTEEQKQESETWRQAAVDGGDYWSLQDVAVKHGSTTDGVAAWESLWGEGYFSALPALSVLYQRGIDGGPPDYVRSFAYNYLQLKLVEAAYANGQGNVTLTQVVAVEDALRRAGGFLSPAENEDALRVAEQLLRESVNCCAGVG